MLDKNKDNEAALLHYSQFTLHCYQHDNCHQAGRSEGIIYWSLPSLMLHAARFNAPRFESPDYRYEYPRQQWSYCRRRDCGKEF